MKLLWEQGMVGGAENAGPENAGPENAGPPACEYGEPLMLATISNIIYD